MKQSRRSLRLKGYDYSQAGAYFVTICTHNRECLFGGVLDGHMRLNDAGRSIQAAWETLPHFYPHAVLDAVVVMPNHVHGIIILVGAGFKPAPTVRGHGDFGILALVGILALSFWWAGFKPARTVR